MTRVVFDANVWISALVFKGEVAALVDIASADPLVELVISPPILNEIEEALARPKFRLDGRIVSALVDEIRNHCAVVSPPAEPPVVLADPDDDRVLECAAAGKAEWIVTGDAHLLKMRTHKGIDIVTPGDMLLRLAPR